MNVFSLNKIFSPFGAVDGICFFTMGCTHGYSNKALSGQFENLTWVTKGQLF
jgi:hypothetical protein